MKRKSTSSKDSLRPEGFGKRAFVNYLQLRTLAAHYTLINQHWCVRLGTGSPYWRFYINLDSGARVGVDNKWYEIPKNKVFIIPPHVLFRGDCPGPIRHCYYHVDSVGLSLQSIAEVFPRPFVLELNRRMIAELKTYILEHFERDSSEEVGIAFRVKALLYHVMGMIFSELSEEQNQMLASKQGIFAQIRPSVDAIHRDPSARLENVELAKLCHLSVNHFIRLFRESMHQTPTKYINAHRIQLAVYQLLHTNDSIEHVAEQCGFENRYYFTRVFSKHTGVAPATYRSQNRVG